MRWNLGEEIVSLAIIEALPGKREELISMLRELYTLMHSKGYSRDTLRRDASQPDRFFHTRYWKSEDTRAEALHDPQVHHYWLRLPALCNIPTVYESLETVFET
jgi:quinol monooxygenase YgiN